MSNLIEVAKDEKSFWNDEYREFFLKKVQFWRTFHRGKSDVLEK